MENNTWIVGDDDEVIVIDPGHDAAGRARGRRRPGGPRRDLHARARPARRGRARGGRAGRGAGRAAPRGPAVLAGGRTTRSPEIEMEDGGDLRGRRRRAGGLHAPGHSPGSVCLYCEELGAVFSGDAAGRRGPAPHEGEFPDFPGQLSSIGRDAADPAAGRPGCCPGTARRLTVAAAEKPSTPWVSAGPDAAGEDA